MKNVLSNDIKFSFLRIIFRFTPFFSYIYQTIGAQSLLINQDHINGCGIEPIVKLQVSTKCKRLNYFVVSKYVAQGKC